MKLINSFTNTYKAVMFIVIIVFIVSCNSAQKDDSITTKKDEWKGKYDIEIENDSTTIKFEMELITADDGKVYGYMESDFESYESPIALDSVVKDSLYFHAYTNRLRLTKTDSLWRGKFTFLRKEFDVVMRPTDQRVRQSLIDSKDFTPLQFDKEFESNAWATPISPNEIYLVSQKRIYLANKEGEEWKTQEVNYDRENWEFYSIGISADHDKLIAHGKPLNDSLPHQGGGDYYFLELESPTNIREITQLPASINTDSYDIFPWMTTQGDILLSTWGKVEEIEQSGRGDIYLAKNQKNGSYEVEEFDKKINTEKAEAGVFMDSKSRFIIFHINDRKEDLPDRLHISKKTDSGWSEPLKLSSPVNRDFIWTYGGRIDPQGKYLYFNTGFRGQSEIYRVATKDVPELSPYF